MAPPCRLHGQPHAHLAMTSPDRAWIQGLHRPSTVYGGTGHGIGSRVRGAAWRSYKSQLNAGWVSDIFYGGSYGIDAPAHRLL
jgi:hypothetical protein